MFVPSVELSLDEDGLVAIMTIVTDPTTAMALVGKEFDAEITNIKELDDEND
jgi:hypothetical protein